MKNRQAVYQIISVILSALIVFAAYLYVAGGEPIFKGVTEGETIKCRVIRVTDVKTSNVSGENEVVTVLFKAQALNTALRGKTLDVIQEIDMAYAFRPRQVEQGDKILVEGYTQSGEHS